MEVQAAVQTQRVHRVWLPVGPPVAAGPAACHQLPLAAASMPAGMVLSTCCHWPYPGLFKVLASRLCPSFSHAGACTSSVTVAGSWLVTSSHGLPVVVTTCVGVRAAAVSLLLLLLQPRAVCATSCVLHVFSWAWRLQVVLIWCSYASAGGLGCRV